VDLEEQNNLGKSSLKFSCKPKEGNQEAGYIHYVRLHCLLLSNIRACRRNEMVMKQNRFADDEANKTVRNSAKIDGDVNTVASSICTSSSSYDTTEDLTDTDTSSQNKPNNPSRRKNNSSNVSKNSSVDTSEDGTRVQFGMKAITTREVESHQNFTAKERSNYWWSDREKDRMMAKHERLVAKYEQQRSPTKPGTLKKSSSASSKLGSYRGLESWTAAGSLKLEYTIEQCISAVMDEQDRQWNDNDDDSTIIAKMSLVVTEDSARRARLNGLQDAQEALKVRGESWCLKGGSDELSVGSAFSTGTAAIAKKKKRSKLLARLDDSLKLPKSYVGSDKEDVLASFRKNSSKKDKKKKKKSTLTASKSKKKRNSKEKSSIGGSFDSSTDQDQANSKRTIATEPSTIASIISGYGKPPLGASSTPAIAVGGVASFSSASMPISPLTTSADEYPLLSTLRRQQEQLRQSSGGSHDDRKSSIVCNQQQQQDEPYEIEGEDLLTTLRRQQKKQALEWQHQQHQQHQQDDPSDAGSTSTSGEPAESTSDPPGRRPRRLASRHGASRSAHQIVGANRAIPENSIVDDSSATSSKIRRNRSKSRDRTKRKGDPTTTPLLQEQPDSSWIDPSKTTSTTNRAAASSHDSGGLKGIKSLRDGAKTFFKNVSKK